MSFQVSYTPPALNAAVLLAAAKAGIEEAGAQVLLEAARPLVPRRSGELVGSGRVESGPDGARVIFDAVSPDGYAYGIRNHEDLTLHHPNGGQAKFLEQPMHTEAGAVAAVQAAGVQRVLGL